MNFIHLISLTVTSIVNFRILVSLFCLRISCLIRSRFCSIHFLAGSLISSNFYRVHKMWLNNRWVSHITTILSICFSSLSNCSKLLSSSCSTLKILRCVILLILKPRKQYGICQQIISMKIPKSICIALKLTNQVN